MSWESDHQTHLERLLQQIHTEEGLRAYLAALHGTGRARAVVDPQPVNRHRQHSPAQQIRIDTRRRVKGVQPKKRAA